MLERSSTRVGLVGAGRLAASLAAALQAAGYRVAAVASAREASARELAARLESGPAAREAQAVADDCDLVFLTVPDGAIAAVAGAVRWREGQAVVHCSGALGLDILAPAREAGANIGCLHPLQSFPSREGAPARFRGITCGVQGAEPLGAALERVARDLGATPVRLEGVDRALYHAAAVFASNYVVSLMAAAARTWEQAGLPLEAARPALAPLLLGAAGNIEAHELPEALTGPVARGDIATVQRHLAALDDASLRALYRGLAAELLRLPLGHSPEVASRLEALLREDAS
jgi:predicted short-subunit dehydrogenase-like oxidoreductase (DUF2520 family)